MNSIIEGITKKETIVAALCGMALLGVWRWGTGKNLGV